MVLVLSASFYALEGEECYGSTKCIVVSYKLVTRDIVKFTLNPRVEEADIEENILHNCCSSGTKKCRENVLVIK